VATYPSTPPPRDCNTGRIVHVTCTAALATPDWLPWPLNRHSSENLPKINLEAFAARGAPGGPATAGVDSPHCAPLGAYQDSKLAQLLHSLELNRRLNGGSRNRGVAQAVDPGDANPRPAP